MFPSTNSYYLTLRGIRIHLVEKGADRTPTLLFIHGRCLSVNSWESQFASPLLATYRLIAIDLPGHGLSERVPHNSSLYSLKHNADLLVELVRRLRLNKVILVGHSLGGHIALQSIPDLPECQGVFALTMPLAKPMQFERMYQHRSLLLDVYQQNPNPYQVREYIRILLRSHATAIPDFLESDFYRTDPSVHAGLVKGLLANDYDDETEIVHRSNLSVAIVVGRLEQVHNLMYLHSVSMPMWQGKPILIPSAGHLVQWENASEVNRRICQFIDSMG